MDKKLEMKNAQAPKRLLYIGHSYHNKTKSSVFLKDLLRSVYEVSFIDIDPYNDEPKTYFNHLKKEEFDVLVLFQITPNIEQLKNIVHFKHAVFFPMFDEIESKSDQFWEIYRDFNIINFSRTLHERLIHLGFSSHYIQYFPKPVDSFVHGDSTHAFFWQRVTDLNINVVEKLLAKTSINKIHIHKVLDPAQKFQEPSPTLTDKIKYSSWYETREKMLKDIESCAIYIAPRPSEGIGMSFLEAMAMGRCVIAPDHPTMNEYIVNHYTGLLYDYHLPKAVKTDNINKIQENAIEYIRKGYHEWEKNKYKILDWLEAPLQKNKRLGKSSRYTSIKSYSMLTIPLLVKKDRPNKRYYDILGFIRFMKSKRKGNIVTFYIFGLIPIWVIK